MAFLYAIGVQQFFIVKEKETKNMFVNNMHHLYCLFKRNEINDNHL